MVDPGRPVPSALRELRLVSDAAEPEVHRYADTDDPPPIVLEGQSLAEEHPGQQCHEAHPDRPHRVGAPILAAPSVREIPGVLEQQQLSEPDAPDVGSASWDRFDAWAEQMRAFGQQAVDAAAEQPDTAEAALEVARLCERIAKVCRPSS
jgi:hypothetical protein